MANCYLCQYEIVDYSGPVRIPAGVWQQLRPFGIPWGSLDLSSDGRGGGKDYAFVATTGTMTEQTTPRIMALGTETTPVGQAGRNQVSAELGVTVTGITIAAIVEEVLISQGLVVRPDGAGMIRIWLGPVLLVERPA